MYRDKKGQLWITKTLWVDLETGEILTKYQYESEYTKIKHEIIYKDEYSKSGEHRKIKEYQWLCRRTGKQTSLF